jgi:hypothetical protein
MSTLSKEVVIDKIEVLADEQIQVREKTAIMEDGKEISASYHRWVLAPGDDLTDQDVRVTAVAQALWTTEVVAAYKATQQAPQ